MNPKNFSDGLEILVTKRISVYSSYEELLTIDKEIFGYKVAKCCISLYELAEALGISAYYAHDELEDKKTTLTINVNHYITYIRQHGFDDHSYFEVYQAVRIIFSVCILCPYVIPREEIYDFWRWCVMKNIF